MGGVERHVLELLEGFPGTEMVVPGIEGWAAQQAKKLAGKYTFIARPRFADVVRAVRGADIAHIHTINNDPVLAAAVQIAAPRRIVVTVHNEFDSHYSEFADRTLVFSPALLPLSASPSRTRFLPYGIPLPQAMQREPATAPRPVRLLEVRRPDKPMSCLLADVLSHPLLQGLELEARVVGVSGDVNDGRVTNLGEVEDPTEHMQWADLIVHFSETETFGRVVYESMAHGALPVVTPLPVFQHYLAGAPQAWCAADHTLAACATTLRDAIVASQDAQRLQLERERNFAWLQQTVSNQVMLERIAREYDEVASQPPAPKSFGPDDVPEGELDRLGEVLDALVVARQPVSATELAGLSASAQGVAKWACGLDAMRPAPERFAALIEALRLSGPRLDVTRQLGALALELGEVELAASALQTAVQLDPHIVWPYLSLLEAHAKAGQLGQALQAAEGLVQHNPQYPEGPALVARLKEMTGPA